MTSSVETDNLEQGYYKQSGTVLQRRDSVTSGGSLLLFLRDLGPRWVSTPGSIAKNRFGGAAEPLVWGTYDLYQGPGRLYLKSAEVKEDFLSLRSDPVRLMAAVRFYKNVTNVTMTTHESNHILNILWSSMLLLKEKCPVGIVEFRYIWKLLNSAGLAPSLSLCCECGTLISDRASWVKDGLCCDKCCPDRADIAQAEIAFLRRAALLEHDKFIKWSIQQEKYALCEVYTKKLLTFF